VENPVAARKRKAEVVSCAATREAGGSEAAERRTEEDRGARGEGEVEETAVAEEEVKREEAPEARTARPTVVVEERIP
jgi:hypothetical protein